MTSLSVLDHRGVTKVLDEPLGLSNSERQVKVSAGINTGFPDT